MLEGGYDMCKTSNQRLQTPVEEEDTSTDTMLEIRVSRRIQC